MLAFGRVAGVHCCVLLVLWSAFVCRLWLSAERTHRAAALSALREVFQLPGGHTVSRGRRKKSVPVFMSTMYDELAHDPRDPLRGYVVRCFGERGNVTASDVFTFVISGLGPAEEMVEAELHLHRMEVSSWGSESSSPYYLIRVYQRLSADASFPLDSNRLLGVQHVAVPSAGWHVINVRVAVADWLAGRRPNLGFLVHVSTSAGRPAAVRFHRRRTDEMALLVLFLREARAPVNLAASVVRRRWRSVVAGTRGSRNSTPGSTVDGGVARCRLQQLWVDFDDLGLSNWIVAPRGFDCGQCVGDCGGGGGGSTGHAALLGALRRLGRKAPAPACAPSTLRPLTTLTCHPQGGTCALRLLEALVAVGCRCH